MHLLQIYHFIHTTVESRIRTCNAYFFRKDHRMAKEQMVSSSPATISIEKSLGAIDKFFSPKTIARVNDTAIKITKLKGEHTHLVVRERLRRQYD